MAVARSVAGEGLPRESTADGGGFVLDEVEGSGFMRYVGRQALRLEHQFTVITGETGAGETAVGNVVGLDYEGFRNSTFVRQEEMRGLGSSTGAVRLAVFSKLFRLETFDRAQEIAAERFREADLAVKQKEQEIATRLENQEKLPKLRESLELSDRALGIAREALSKLNAALEKDEARRQELEAGHEAFVA